MIMCSRPFSLNRGGVKPSEIDDRAMKPEIVLAAKPD